MKNPLSAHEKIAFIMSPQFGDSLLSMIIVHNLQKQGYQITVFSNYLCGLRRWFPQADIHPYPQKIDIAKTLKDFDVLLHTYPHDVLYRPEQASPRIIVLDQLPLHRQLINMVDLQMAVCRDLFGLTDVVSHNGLMPPINLVPRTHQQRIIIHPTARLKEKHWPPKRFIQLANTLKERGFQPVFCIAPSEQSTETWITDHHLDLMVSNSLDELAAFIYESGWFIGCDSALGHLASNLGVPTISLMQRRKIKLRWRPNWAPGEALLPWAPLFLRQWKEHYWKYFISVSAVLQAFERLQEKVNLTHSTLIHANSSESKQFT